MVRMVVGGIMAEAVEGLVDMEEEAVAGILLLEVTSIVMM